MSADVFKRSVDVAAAVVGIAVLLPVFFCVALAIKTTSRGPVLFRGVRTGRHGIIFRIYKFRTMVVDAERLGGSTTALGDARITSVGQWLRRTKIDELPQLINVLKGDMSIVGPRPEVPEYTTMYRGALQRILSVRPGITDLASMHFHDLQACVGPKDADRVFRENILPVKNRLRLKYVDERTILGDSIIILRTLAIVIMKPWRQRG